LDESIAIDSLITYQKKRGIEITVQQCGLFINFAIPWLAATPDSLVCKGMKTWDV